MAISSINSSRVSLQLQSQRLMEAVRYSRFTSYTEQNRLASGRAYLLPSDDPVAANRANKLNEILDQQSQLMANIGYAANMLNATDEALGDVSSLLSQAHTIASQNVDSMTSADERAAAGELIASIREQLVLIGNREFDGRYLFAGRDTTAQPFVGALEGVAYSGDTGDVLARVSNSELESINLTGDTLYGALSSRVIGAVDLNPAVTTETRLDELNGAVGLGVRKGVLVFNEPTGAGAVSVNLSTADTLGDVVDMINQAATEAGAGFTASLSATGINIAPGGDLSITDTGTGAIAADLGIMTDPAAAAPIVGADLGVRLTRTTLVSELNGGAGLTLTDPIRITNGSSTASIDLSGAATIQDIINEINNSGLSVRAEVNDDRTGLNVVNLVSGTRMSIAEDGGTTAATLGVNSLNTTTTLSSLNYGRSLTTAPGEADIRIIAKDGTRLEVNLDDAGTVGDVLDLINQAAIDAGVALTASMTADGNGWRLDDATGGGGGLQVYPLNPDFNASAMGLNRTADPAAVELVVNDLSPARGDDVLSVLYDLEEALMSDDTNGITVAGERLTMAMEDVGRRRGVIGAEGKAMQDRMVQMENASAAGEVFLSQVQDLDYAEAATRFEQAQTSLQASLLTGSQVMSISLLDYLG